MLESIYQSQCSWQELRSFQTRYWIRVQVKKLVISSTITEVKIISLCNLDEILSKENYFDKSFLVDALLILQNELFSLHSLINSDSAVYIIIHINLVDKVCKELKIQPISLTKEKLIKEYDEKIFKKTITHKILLNLIIESHKKLTVSMLIADINHHEVILEKSWMNKNEILLNMRINVIVFSNQLDTFISIFEFLSIQSTQVDRDQLRLLLFLSQRFLEYLNDLFQLRFRKSHSQFKA